jgi:hypothetical protein
LLIELRKAAFKYGGCSRLAEIRLPPFGKTEIADAARNVSFRPTKVTIL